MKSRAALLWGKWWTSALTASARSLKVSKTASIRHAFRESHFSPHFIIALLIVPLPQHQTGERKYIGLERHHDSHQSRQRKAVEEYVAQDVAFVPVPLGSGAGYDDALRIDHFAHDPTRTVGGAHQDRREPDLLCGDLLQAAEQHVGRGVRTGQGHAQPSEQGPEERIHHPRSRERQAHGGIHARVAG